MQVFDVDAFHLIQESFQDLQAQTVVAVEGGAVFCLTEVGRGCVRCRFVSDSALRIQWVEVQVLDIDAFHLWGGWFLLSEVPLYPAHSHFVHTSGLGTPPPPPCRTSKLMPCT